MYVEIDLSRIPVAVRLVEADDFSSFKVVVTEGSQAAVEVATVLDLASKRADDPDWRESFDSMLSAAGRCGWILPDGSIAAHVQRAPTPGGG